MTEDKLKQSKQFVQELMNYFRWCARIDHFVVSNGKGANYLYSGNIIHDAPQLSSWLEIILSGGTIISDGKNMRQLTNVYHDINNRLRKKYVSEAKEFYNKEGRKLPDWISFHDFEEDK